MAMNIFWTISLFISLFSLAMPTQAQEERAYADVILDAYYSHANPKYNQFYGGDGDRYPLFMDPRGVLGHNTKFVSLPKGSYIIVGFTDNTIIDAPNQDDLFIEEVGRAGDQAAVWVSEDGKKFTYLGRAKDDKVTSFDLADIGFKKPVIAVKIMGLDTRGASPGFDLVSVRAMQGAVGGKPSPRLIPKYVPPPPTPKPTPKPPVKVVEITTRKTKVVTHTTTTKKVDRKQELRNILKNSGLRSKLKTLKKRKKKTTVIINNQVISTPKKVDKNHKKKPKKKKVKEAGAESNQ
ncbi:hypothetical protein [Microscilla marina]|uniref:Uncharacterized protein n=1 Tax=Microscilla marina ATCC 23134 TaxID=313606 RepID=A1ZSB2_MICM2|nr:hypothetical protein [Microscilla marina]EAY26660.1 hypothetical protein M23134_02911 [Microscilla marina ATCC 23134]